jgi:hypothetical protein
MGGSRAARFERRISDMTRLSTMAGLFVLLILSASRACFAAGSDVAPIDPFVYCAAIRDIDAPIGGASPIPPGLTPYLARALGLPPHSAVMPERYYWRCMGGAVYVCTTGANIACEVKADLAKRNVGAENYCRENRDAPFVPAYATGHATIYDWRCSGGRAVRGKRLAKLDSRGYRRDIWYRVARE